MRVRQAAVRPEKISAQVRLIKRDPSGGERPRALAGDPREWGFRLQASGFRLQASGFQTEKQPMYAFIGRMGAFKQRMKASPGPMVGLFARGTPRTRA